jgi:hypothetical protein
MTPPSSQRGQSARRRAEILDLAEGGERPRRVRIVEAAPWWDVAGVGWRELLADFTCQSMADGD